MKLLSFQKHTKNKAFTIAIMETHFCSFLSDTKTVRGICSSRCYQSPVFVEFLDILNQGPVDFTFLQFENQKCKLSCPGLYIDEGT